MSKTSSDLHIAQYWHNKTVLGFLTSGQVANFAYDWIIIIRFYCALHIVDSHITSEMKKKVELDFRGGHEERNYIVRNEPLFDAISGAYEDLYKYSRNARYCFLYDELTSKMAKRCLEKIEEYFRINRK